MRTRRKPTPTDRDPDLDAPIDQLIEDVIPDPKSRRAWRAAKNTALGGHSPDELIGTPRESVVRDMLRAAKQGMFS
jgi:hypothetical protein